jgi:uncharacterized protein (TIGR02246 family)
VTPTLEPPTTTADETALHALFARLEHAWNAGDATAYSQCFTPDSDYITFEGGHLQGRHANAEAHQKLFETFVKGSKLTGQIKDIRFLTPDVAVLHATGNVRLRWQSRPAPGRESIQTYVAVKRDGTWRFAAFHNSRIAQRDWYHYLGLMLGRR